MMRSFRSFHYAVALSLGLAVIGQPQTVMAQEALPSVRFLKAVTDRDGTAVMTLLGTASNGLINTADRDSGETALHIVTQRGDSEWIRFMIGKGANPDVLDKAGRSPLMIAVFNSDSETAQLLLDLGASANFANSRGETALIRAVQLRKPVLVRMLVAHGADPDRADYVAGLSARDYATRDARSDALLDALTPRSAEPDDALPNGPIFKPGG
ncbi:ankyrin repeat domain-containing protein [Sphingorhabdus soli]|uniref:Ankyrin repeat domain-containing protein n=1 Tax=Flavisphingopyxis soli TaxID=2601267 RepID=A0A5C6UMS8_9SPHN|nr:ankyrin repeat domain-containing protein [Sphingorhabdus soli]TXC73421.1 ankyrin repeat domain-containing protein [Sphingorhabdus soli]